MIIQLHQLGVCRLGGLGYKHHISSQEINVIMDLDTVFTYK